MLIIAPSVFAGRRRRICCASKSGARKFTAMWRSKSSGAKSAALSGSNADALFTSNVTGPKARSACAKRMPDASCCRRSHAATTALPPRSRIRSASASPSSLLAGLVCRTSENASLESRCTMAAPIRRAAPVTIATGGAAFALIDHSRDEPRLFERRHSRRECIEPADEARIDAAPRPGKTQVLIAERAGKRNRADIDVCARRRGFERSERALDLAGLISKPAFDHFVFGAVAPLIHAQDRCIENTVGERLQGQRGKAGVGINGDDLVAAGEVIEIFEDDGTVVERFAVLGDQRRDFAERILPPDRVRLARRIGRDNVDPFRKPEMKKRDADLASEWRGRRRAQDRHGRFPLLSASGVTMCLTCRKLASARLLAAKPFAQHFGSRGPGELLCERG